MPKAGTVASGIFYLYWHNDSRNGWHSITGMGGTMASGISTFIANLKQHGYYTVGIGKISHYPDGHVYPYTALGSDKLELPFSWNEMLFNPGKWETGWNAFFLLMPMEQTEMIYTKK